MARKSVIDAQGLGPRVLTMAAGGMSHRKIAEVLAKEGVKLSHVAVMNYLQVNLADHRQATEQVKAAVQAELQRNALTDVQMLEKLRDELARVVFDEPPPVMGVEGPILHPVTKDTVIDRNLWLKATKELRDTITARLNKAGAGDEGGVKVTVDLL